MNETAQKLYKELKEKYKRSIISKKELAQELGCTVGAIDQNMKKKNNILPSHKKMSLNGRVFFPLAEVAIFLSAKD